MAGGSQRRQRISDAFGELCDALSLALGAAEGHRDAAVRAHAEAMVEMWLRTEGLDSAGADPGLARTLANRQLAAVVGRVEKDWRAAFAPWLAEGPPRLAALIGDAAPGSAGTRPQDWPTDPSAAVGKVEADGPVPTLWYIGDGGIGDNWIEGGGVGDGPPAGFPVAVPLLDESHLQISSSPKSRAAAEALVQNLLLRVLSYFRPGLVQVHVWDVGSFSGSLPGLYPLTRAGLLTVHDPSRLPQLLEELSIRIRRVHTRVLIDGQPSLRALAATPDGARTEPWVVAVLIGNRSSMAEEEHRQLQRVARGGLACGVQLVLLDVPVTLNAAVETVQLADDQPTRTSMTGPHVGVRLEPPRPLGAVTDACHAIADGYDEWRSRISSFEDLLPRGSWGGEGSHGGLVAPVAFTDGEQQVVRLDDASPHALIGGPSGSGKTNLLLTMISSLAARYRPEELEFYLLDFKEGVSFAQLAPSEQRATWLPHARLIGVNINTDREFGVALLQFLADEMRRRAAAAKAAGVTKLEELRAHPEHRDERWPRIVAVIDEFQYLFNESDAVTRAATVLLEDVARRGRSQGIHLVLASQDTSGIQAFWGRPAVFEQFVLRIALPRARRVLVDTNDAAVGLPRWHAVINHESGTKHGNQVVRIPNASTTGLMGRVQRDLLDEYGDEHPKPRLFDGSRSPRITTLISELRSDDDPAPRAVLGQCIDVDGRAATVRLTATPGRNLGVLASVGTDAIPVLAAAAGSLAGQYPARTTVSVVIAPLVAEAAEVADRVAQRFTGPRRFVLVEQLGGVRERIALLAAEVGRRLQAGVVGDPVLVVLFAADAAERALDRAGTEALRTLLRSGPETGVHVLGWWRSIQRLRAVLTMGASVDDLGAWVALDVHGAELGPLVPGMQVGWAPRPGRGLFFDRAQHAQPEVIIVPATEAW